MLVKRNMTYDLIDCSVNSDKYDECRNGDFCISKAPQYILRETNLKLENQKM